MSYGEELIIKFYTTNEDGKDIIRYAIGGVDKGTFIDKDGKLVGSITGDLTESLKNNTTMLGIYKNYLEQNKFSTKARNVLSTGVSSVGQGFQTGIYNPIKEGLSKTNFGLMKQFNLASDRLKKTAGKKTKSKRSPNANKTLKNRK
jgi:hypothetical protein